MASERARELTLRRERLRVRSAELRLRAGLEAQVLAPPLALADQVRAGVQWLREHPEWPLGALVVFAVLKPRRVFRLARRAWWGWRLWRRAERLVALFTAPRRSWR